VQQERCGMKVSTDACIQGAWTPIAGNVKYVLDIGTGTGLLSLMLAQRNSDIIIDAIELDEAAAQQACENAATSPWADRIKVLQGDVKTYPFNRGYDMVICNPPFFHNSLQSTEAARNNARHSTQLTLNALEEVVSKVLTADGYAAIILPAAEHEHLQKLFAEKGWANMARLMIVPKPGAEANRIVSLWTKNMTVPDVTETIQVRDSSDGYTEAFKELLHPFYLFL